MIRIKQAKFAALQKQRHPWVFSGAVAAVEGPQVMGEPLRLSGPQDRVLGWGLYAPHSRIAVRMLNFTAEPPPADWLEQRLARAHELRNSLLPGATAYRLCHAEGDFLPGLIIDRYARVLVVRPLTLAMEALLARLGAKLRQLYPDCAIYLKRDEYTARQEGLSVQNGFLHGEGDGREIIEEHGLRYYVDYLRGQKTGFYLDQRMNRKQLLDLAAGKRVLNLFCYTGGFSLAAALGGASRIVSVDSSAAALELAARNLELNERLDSALFAWEQADALDYLQRPLAADLIVLDPPPFARKRGELPGALKGYGYLNQLAIAKVAPAGLILTFSCSGAVDKTEFRRMLVRAGRKSGRNVRLLRELQASADHPVSLQHPEGEYLKGWLLHVE